MGIRNLSILIPTYSALRRDVKRQRRFIHSVIEPEIEYALKTNDGSLDGEDFDKIRNYYGFGVPAIVGEGFCTLRGKPMNERERLASTYQGALTGLYDDFFDKTHLHDDEIRKMMDDPPGYEAKSSLEKLFVSFLKNVHENIQDKASFNQSFYGVYMAQMESKKQASDEISEETIREITFKKGGASLLFYRSIFGFPFMKEEEDALYHAGALMQLGNDIFDVYKDDRQHISTLMTRCKKVDQVRQIFNHQLDKSISLIRETSYDGKNINTYLRKFVLGISRCFVCLDQMERLEQKTGGHFNPAEYSRQELICDMEKPHNILSSLRYFTGYKF